VSLQKDGLQTAEVPQEQMWGRTPGKEQKRFKNKDQKSPLRKHLNLIT
jgi:hypothetical protein